MFLHLRFKRVWEIFKTRLYDLKHSGWVVLLEMLQLVPQKLGMKLLEMGKDVKIKYTVSSPPYKLWETFFCKKLCMGEQIFWANLWGDDLHGE